VAGVVVHLVGHRVQFWGEQSQLAQAVQLAEQRDQGGPGAQQPCRCLRHGAAQDFFLPRGKRKPQILGEFSTVATPLHQFLRHRLSVTRGRVYHPALAVRQQFLLCPGGHVVPGGHDAVAGAVQVLEEVVQWLPWHHARCNFLVELEGQVIGLATGNRMQGAAAAA